VTTPKIGSVTHYSAQIWIHVALNREDKGLQRKQTTLESIIEKKSLINLLQAFPVAVKVSFFCFRLLWSLILGFSAALPPWRAGCLLRRSLPPHFIPAQVRQRNQRPHRLSPPLAFA
jgi:hypothetical protein